MSIGAILLSFSTIALDNLLMHHQNKSIEWMFIIRPEGARAILATIAGSMITVAGVTFSMTVVAVSFSIGQIGPRLIQNFMRDRANQFTLGIFISTFLYSVLVLLTVVSPNEVGNNAFTPHISIITALILANVSIGFFIFFIHHIPESINVFNLLAKISDEYQTQLNLLFPEKVNSNKCNENKKRILPGSLLNNSKPIISKKNGYVRYIDNEGLFKLAIELDCMIEVKCQPGTFVTTRTPLMYVNKILNQKQQDDCRNSCAIGDEKNQEHDLLFLSDEIVEIIAHALSPGINAPFIAITAIDWLQVMIESLSGREIPDACRYDEYHKLRLINEHLTMELFIDDVLGKIRSYVSRDRNTLLHLFNVIKMMIVNSQNDQLKNVLKLHAAKLFAAANEKLTTNEDKEDIQALITEIVKL